MPEKRGWPDWIKGVALYGITDQGQLVLLRADQEGNLSVKILPHAVTHQAGGSDEINVDGLHGTLADLQWAKWSVYDLRANFPPPGVPGRLAYATDEKRLYRDNGAEWVLVLSMAPQDVGVYPHAYTHQPGGSDALPTAAPAAITEGATASEGTSTSFARADHVHATPSQWTPKPHAATHQPGGPDALPTGVPSTITEGATASEGTSTAFARADHVHGTPAQWTPKAHASTHQPGGSDALPTGTPTTLTEGATASAGTSTAFARADHVHGTPAQWTPKPHAGTHGYGGSDAIAQLDTSEKLSDLLPRSGSRPMVGPLLGDVSAGHPPEISGLIGDLTGYGKRGTPYLIPTAFDRLLFLTKKGGSITCDKTPVFGSLENIVDGTGSLVYWNAADVPITITITLEADYLYCRDFFIYFHPYWAPSEFTVEWYKADGTLLASDHRTGWQANWGIYVRPGLNPDLYYTRTIKIILQAPASGASYIYLFEVAWAHFSIDLLPTYLRRDSSQPMLADLNMGGNSITNVNLVDGVDVSAHASRHQPGGADPLPTGTPVNITEGATASAGTSTSFARADHVHGTPAQWTPKAHAATHQPGGADALPTGTPVNITEGATASAGTSTAFARADHVHGTPAQWTPKAHASTHYYGGSDVLDVGKLNGVFAGKTPVFSGTAPTAWTLLNISSYVGSCKALVVLEVYCTPSSDTNFWFRPGSDLDDSSDYADYTPGVMKTRIRAGQAPANYVICITDSIGNISWKAQSAQTCQLFLVAYIRLS